MRTNRIQTLIRMAAAFAKASSLVAGTSQSMGFFQDHGDHIVVATPEGSSFLLEHNTAYFLLGFRPEEEGELAFHREGAIPTDVDNLPAIAFTTQDGLIGVISVNHCLRRISTFSSRPTIRHMLNGKCRWVGIKDTHQPPPVSSETEVQIRQPGETVWRTIPRNPLHKVLDQVKVVSPQTSKAEEWRPGDDSTIADAQVAAVINEPEGMPKRKTPAATRATKKPKKEAIGSKAPA